MILTSRSEVWVNVGHINLTEQQVWMMKDHKILNTKLIQKLKSATLTCRSHTWVKSGTE